MAGVNWTPESTADGSVTLRCLRTGSLAGSSSGALTEARERYVGATGLGAFEPGSTVRLLDIGTGPGWNLAAALEAAEERGLRLEAWSLELDAGVLEAARALQAAPFGELLRPVHEALERGSGPFGSSAQASQLEWVLGDARETLPRLEDALRFDVVFLDPFAPADDPPLWEAAFLAEVARRMAPGARLSSYTASLTVRTRLAAAGLRVGSGPKVGAKSQGTVAVKDGPGAPALRPLPPRTQAKLARRLERGLGDASAPPIV